MLKYFFNITLRSLVKRGMFPIINILGLSIGLAVVLLISLLNFYEQSFDKQFKEGKHVYRINSKLTAIMPGETVPVTANAMAPAIQEQIPEVITAVRIYRQWLNLRHNDNPVDIHLAWADADFFRLFDTPFIYGNPELLMSRPNAIAISEELAKKLFGNKNPVGELLSHTLTVYREVPPVEIVAVYKDYPKNSSLKEIQSIAPLAHTYNTWVIENLNWDCYYETFCLLSANADTASVLAKMRQMHFDATEGVLEKGFFYYPQLQRLNDIHLHSANIYSIGDRALMSSLSDISKVRMLSLLSVIILLVACINYMNLSTARAQKRSREIGVSKTIGARRSEIIFRLMLETATFTFIAFVLALALAWMTLPIFNDLLGEQLYIGLALQPGFICLALAIWVITTLLAASYPVMHMSGFPPLMAIRSQFEAKSSHAIVRKVLSVGQFAVAIVLIAWVLVIQAQIVFVNNKDLGYNPINLAGFWSNSGNPEAMLNDFRAESSIETVSCMSSNFFADAGGSMLLRDKDDKTGFPVRSVNADPDMIDVLKIKLIAGRHLPEVLPEEQWDSTAIIPVLLNRAAVEYLGVTPEEAIGKRILFGPNTEVCGVVENFNFESLYRPITGFCMLNIPGWDKRYVMFRAHEGRLWENLETYERLFKKHNPNSTFGMYYGEPQVALLYDGEKRTGKIAIVFSILAIFVACMGVFGLTAFMAEQRTKEIGIRKVMGASVPDIVRLFTNSYVKLLGISLVIAIPAAWWVGNQYLQDFAFRVSIGWWIFAVAALVTVALTLLTVGVQAIKAALKNPVEAVKVE